MQKVLLAMKASATAQVTISNTTNHKCIKRLKTFHPFLFPPLLLYEEKSSRLISAENTGSEPLNLLIRYVSRLAVA